jgi:hypothetical protein
MRRFDEQPTCLPVRLQIYACEKPVAKQEGEHMIVVLAPPCRHVDLDAIGAAEQALGAVAFPDQRIK